MLMFQRLLKWPWWHLEWFRYSVISALGLIVDVTVYSLLATHGSLNLPTASIMGYLSGMVLAYFLFVRDIFKNGWMRHRKTIEVLLFLLSGTMGLSVTYTVVRAYTAYFGAHLFLAKLCAVILSFVSVYAFRKFLVFRTP